MWYFSAEQLENSPSRRHGIDAANELHLRQMTAYLIQDMGQRLDVYVFPSRTRIEFIKLNQNPLLAPSCASIQL